jgi:DNA mismatch repair protein MutS2
MESLTSKLDLHQFIENFTAFFSREKHYLLEGDIHTHYKLIQELENYQFKTPPEIINLDTDLLRLKKLGTLKIDTIFEFVKIIRYFNYLKSLPFEGSLLKWLEKIEIPSSLTDLSYKFSQSELISEEYEEYALTQKALLNVKENIKRELSKSLYTKKLTPYLVDHQIHYINQTETILLRGGFNKVLKATIISRSQSGFFYVVPGSVDNLKRQQNELNAKLEDELFKICKEMSKVLHKFERFLSFINKEFDRFDHYQARIEFARTYDYNFILPNNKGLFILKDFTHPILNNAKPVSIDASKKIIMITGVNAGGKTMLLKSILSALLLSKHLIPFQIHKESKIARFKEIISIIDDPQNVKNDISTFAGRMLEFSKLFNKNNFLAGVDEIELGTDSDEAATLFKVIIEELMKKDIKIVITTHHKRLASFLAAYEEVELIAAKYDETNRVPTYEFMQGTIGKSYAFETAKRYGIPINIINKSYEVYGEDKQRLNELIERSSFLERTLKEEIEKTETERKEVEKIKNSLLTQRDELRSKVKAKQFELEKSYQSAINLAKEAAKKSDKKVIHQIMNKAHKEKNYELKCQEDKIEFKSGDPVKYNNTKGTILSIQGSSAFIQTENMKLKVKLKDLKPSGNTPKIKKRPIINFNKPQHADVKLDLHGMRVEEALEKCDRFINNSLLANFEEVIIYHGIGSGVLGRAVGEFLKQHKSVVDFEDAPPKMGGFGAKIVRL